jgi:hypothetical protein
MITHEFDLSPVSAPVSVSGSAPGSAPTPGFGRWIVLLALALLGAAAGAVLAAVPAGPVQAIPQSATLRLRDVAPDGDLLLVTVRLTVENPGGPLPPLTTLVLDDPGSGRVALPLRDAITTGGQMLIDVRVQARCPAPGAQTDRRPQRRAGRPRAALRVRVLTPAVPAGLPVLLGGPLTDRDGLCGLALTGSALTGSALTGSALTGSVLPAGWQSALAAAHAQPTGADLVLTVPGLQRLDVAAAPAMGGVIETSVQIGDRMVPARITDGTRLRLIGPPPCGGSATGQGGASLPMSARLLIRGPTSLEQRVVSGGPALAAWLIDGCPS